jgi:hypothetical protein
VLGIASVSVEFYLGMKYEFEPDNELWGQATLTVEVEVLMFSKSFELSVERRIAGGSSSAALPAPMFASGGTAPKLASLAAKTGTGSDFTDLVSQDDWNAYAAAFATVS